MNKKSPKNPQRAGLNPESWVQAPGCLSLSSSEKSSHGGFRVLLSAIAFTALRKALKTSGSVEQSLSHDIKVFQKHHTTDLKHL